MIVITLSSKHTTIRDKYIYQTLKHLDTIYVNPATSIFSTHTSFLGLIFDHHYTQSYTPHTAYTTSH
jgi:hypothetical protein